MNSKYSVNKYNTIKVLAKSVVATYLIVAGAAYALTVEAIKKARKERQ